MLSTAQKYSELTGPLMNIQIMLIYANEKINDVYFSRRGKIDKAQLILDRSGLVLKLAKYQLPHLTGKCCAFSVYHFRKLRMRTPFIQRILKF